MAGQPSRALCHRCIEFLAILHRDVGNRVDVLCLNARAEAFDNTAQKNFLDRPFPRFAQQSIEIDSLFLISDYMVIAKQFLRGLPFVLEVSDLLLHGHRDPRQLLRADAGNIRQLANVLVKRRNASFLGELLEQQEENNVVSKDNDLPGLGFLNQPPRRVDFTKPRTLADTDDDVVN